MSKLTLNKKQFCKLVKDVCKAWKYKYPDLRFLEYEYMENTLGMVFLKNRSYNGNRLKKDLMVINEITLFYPFDKILQVIYHELAHFITRKGDEDFEFILFCKLNEIALSEEWEEMEW